MADSTGRPRRDRLGTPFEVLRIFLRLGLSCFGGPIAHLGYFREEFVVRRRWLAEQTYADLVGLCQFLPGPASSQVGFSIGLLRAGVPGALAAWAGFTLPSAVAMVLFAYGAGHFDGPVGRSALHGLKLVAVAIIAQAVWGMARTLCADRRRAAIAVLAALLILVGGSSFAQVLAIASGALLGCRMCRHDSSGPPLTMPVPVSRRTGAACLLAFFGLLLMLPAWAALGHLESVGIFDAFYRSGALVFGGGHVVLPLLRQALVTPGWMSDDAFFAGYGAAQAVPGPLFTFAAYLGAVLRPQPHGITGAALGLLGIFLPGLLILLGVLPYWDAIRRQSSAQAAMRGVNAAVVGILGAALYSPVWTSSVTAPADVALALTGFMLLTVWRVRSWLVVLLLLLGAIGVRCLQWPGIS